MLNEILHGLLLNFNGLDLLSLHLLHDVDEIVGINFHLIEGVVNDSAHLDLRIASRCTYRGDNGSVAPWASRSKHNEVVWKSRCRDAKVAPNPRVSGCLLDTTCSLEAYIGSGFQASTMERSLRPRSSKWGT